MNTLMHRLCQSLPVIAVRCALVVATTWGVLQGQAWAQTTARCADPRSQAERLVCATPDLLQLDREVATAYQASDERFDNGAPASEAVVADLRQSQQSWMAERDRCDETACLHRAYEQRLAELENRARPGHAAPADRLAGEYVQEPIITLFAQVRDDRTLRIAIIGAEPTASRWVCDFDGIGTVEQDGSITVRDPVRPDTTILSIRPLPSGLDVPDTALNRSTSEASCGLNGSLLWPYTRKTDGK